MRRSKKAASAAFSGVLGAVALILVYAASVLPTGSWGVVALAGLLPCMAVISSGMGAGFLCWGGVSILAFFLVPNKLHVALFALLFGLYPMVKALVERLRSIPKELALKLVFFNLAFTAIFLMMRNAVLAAFPSQFSAVWPLYLAGNLVFLAYDYGFSRLISFYVARTRKAVR